MKHNSLRILSILLFVVVNTSFIWDGALSFLWYIIILLIFISLVFSLMYQLRKAGIERFHDGSRKVTLVIMVVSLILIAWRPFGIVDFEKFQGKDVLVADREGVANCHTYLKLKENGRFYMKSICFGVSKEDGTYRCQNDTIYFKVSDTTNSDFAWTMGIVNRDKGDHGAIGELKLFRSVNDTMPHWMRVTMNELK